MYCKSLQKNLVNILLQINSSPLYRLTREGERDRWKEERGKEGDTENECVFGRQVPGVRCEFIRSPTSSSCTHRV